MCSSRVRSTRLWCRGSAFDFSPLNAFRVSRTESSARNTDASVRPQTVFAIGGSAVKLSRCSCRAGKPKTRMASRKRRRLMQQSTRSLRHRRRRGSLREGSMLPYSPYDDQLWNVKKYGANAGVFNDLRTTEIEPLKLVNSFPPFFFSLLRIYENVNSFARVRVVTYTFDSLIYTFPSVTPSPPTQ